MNGKRPREKIGRLGRLYCSCTRGPSTEPRPVRYRDTFALSPSTEVLEKPQLPDARHCASTMAARMSRVCRRVRPLGFDNMHRNTWLNASPGLALTHS